VLTTHHHHPPSPASTHHQPQHVCLQQCKTDTLTHPCSPTQCVRSQQHKMDAAQPVHSQPTQVGHISTYPCPHDVSAGSKHKSDVSAPTHGPTTCPLAPNTRRTHCHLPHNPHNLSTCKSWTHQHYPHPPRCVRLQQTRVGHVGTYPQPHDPSGFCSRYRRGWG
jgi:hypothetical protein